MYFSPAVVGYGRLRPLITFNDITIFMPFSPHQSMTFLRSNLSIALVNMSFVVFSFVAVVFPPSTPVG